MTSPYVQLRPNAQSLHLFWQKSVKATWGYLNRNYVLEDSDNDWITWIDIRRSHGSYPILDHIRVCSAIIYFQTALCELVGHSPLKRNWRDNPNLQSYTQLRLLLESRRLCLVT
jgi:hypothetical protein